MSNPSLLLRDVSASCHCFVSSFVISLLFLLPAPFSLPAQTTVQPPQPMPEVLELLKKAEQEVKVHHWQESLSLYNQTLERSRSLKDRSGEANTLIIIGNFYGQTGQPPEALANFE